jgi:hypothetical protein
MWRQRIVLLTVVAAPLPVLAGVGTGPPGSTTADSARS